MSEPTHKKEKKHPGWKVAAAVVATAFSGPIVGGLLALGNLVLAPPRVFLTGVLYMLLVLLGLPFVVVALRLHWIRLGGLALALAAWLVAALCYLTLIGPWLPYGLPDCQPLPSEAGRVRYECVATSSDRPDYRDEFILQGPSASPLLHRVSP